MNELAELRKRVAELETAEAERKQVHEKFQSFVEHSSDIIQVVDEKAIIRYVSPSVERVLGYKPEELLGRASTDLVHPDDLEKVAEAFGRVRQPGATTTVECRCRHKDGSWRVIEGTGTNHFDLPAVNGFISNMHDVTERKQAEAALRESEEKYRAVFESTGTAMVIIEEDTTISLANQESEALLGYARQEVEGKKSWTEFVVKEDLERMKGHHKSRRMDPASAPRNYEFRVVDRQGTIKDILLTVVMIPGTKKSVASLLDLTERKRAEEALEKSREFSESLIASMQDGFSVLDPNGVHIDVNPAFCSMTGFSREELVGSGSPHPYWPPEDYQTIENAFEKTLKGEFGTFELTFMRKNGERFPVLVSPSWIRDEQGNVVSYFATIKDITERKRAEKEARYQRDYFQSLFEGSPEAVATLDLRRQVMDINPAFEKLFGHALEDIKGKDMHTFMLPQGKEREGKDVSRRASRGEIVATETVRRAADGREIPVSLLGAPVIVEGRQIGILAIYRDISERKRTQEELESSRDELRRLATQLQLVREEERAAVAWELHDEVGQALAALQIDLRWLERRLSRDDTGLLEKAQSMSRLIQNNTERLRRLYMELRPGMLDDLGLAPTIEWRAEEFQKSTGIKSVLSLDQDSTPRDAGCSLAVYRVFQEALSNVVRHAEATEVNISLTKTDNRIVLEIADNGRGTTKKLVSAPGSSGLVGMRERLRPWGGKVTVTGVPGKGTTVRVSIPVGKGEL